MLSRRQLLLFAPAPRLFGRNNRECPEPEQRVPSDNDQLNAFAKVYNDYVKALAAGVMDLHKWTRVKDRWRAMTG